MRSNRRRCEQTQLRFFASQAPPATWASVPEKSKRRLRRLLSRMIREAAERAHADVAEAGGSDE